MVTSWAVFIIFFAVLIVLPLAVFALYLDRQILLRVLLLQVHWCRVRTYCMCSPGSEVYPLLSLCDMYTFSECICVNRLVCSMHTREYCLIAHSNYYTYGGAER